jgi:hypothetical protein
MKAWRELGSNAESLGFADYGSSEDEEIEEAKPRVGRKKRGDDSDSGSDVSLAVVSLRAQANSL